MTDLMEPVSSTPRERAMSLPAKVTVTLRAGAVLAAANVICALIVATAWTRVRTPPKTITVTGSAKKVIQSDLLVWRGTISVNNPDLVQGFDALKIATDKALAYLRQQEVPEKDVTVSSIHTAKHFQKDERGNDTDKVSSYELSQTIEVNSTDVIRVAEVARHATELIKEGVLLESAPPRYLYTKLAELKIEMLAEATKDARARAAQIAENSGGKLGAIREADMGVMQINPLHSAEVSDFGNNDTTSLQKEIMAVVHATFGLE